MEIAGTASVKRVQEEWGSASIYNGRIDRPGDRFGEAEKAFIGQRDSFYIASVSESGWPYVQHRGGPPGFLCVLDERMLGCADYPGNRQYISTGNILAEPKVCLFLMDYANQRRLKIYANARIVSVDDEPELTARLSAPSPSAAIERFYLFELAALDWNCPKFITPRFTGPEISAGVAPLHGKIAQLEAELAALKAEFGR